MDLISKPPMDQYRALVSACAQNYSRNATKDRKRRILSSLDELELSAMTYDEKAKSGSLSDIREHAVCGAASKDDLVDLYTSKFVPDGRPGRPTYTAILQSAYRGRCALCGQLPVSTIDHYLPKSKFPAFAVFPRNMVPACERCNFIKLTTSDRLTLHPYYDDVAAMA